MDICLPLLVLTCFVLLVVLIMCKLAEAPMQRLVAAWTLVGVVCAVLKSLLVQMAPQWADLPPDSMTFVAHAEALRAHWLGMAVDPISGRLNGYQAGYQLLYGAHWLPDAPISYTGALGTQEWIYSAFLAGCQFAGEGWEYWAMLANAVLAGSFPAATFLLVRHLGGGVKVGHIGALLVVMEPSTAVNSAWFIKDTMAGFIATIVAVLICCLCSKRSWSLAIALGAVLALLAGIRFVAYASFVVVLMAWSLQLLSRRKFHLAAALGGASALSILIWGLIYFTPVIPKADQVLIGLRSPIQAQVTTLRAENERERGADKSVIEWKSYSLDKPGRAILRAVARTLMAPYPWVVFTQGLTKTNAIELYLPGTAIWIVCLPAIFLGMRTSARQAGSVGRALLIFLAVIACAYIAYFGEWSTRQRVFMIPLFFAFAAIGFNRVWYMRFGASDSEMTHVRDLGPASQS